MLIGFAILAPPRELTLRIVRGNNGNFTLFFTQAPGDVTDYEVNVTSLDPVSS